MKRLLNIFREVKLKSETFFESNSTSGKIYAKFLSLSKQSTLITPVPLTKSAAYRYSSLGPFVKKSRTKRQIAQVDEVIRQAALEALAACDQKRPTFFSTAGTAVYWLHFRFDRKPKYYQSEYRQMYPWACEDDSSQSKPDYCREWNKINQS